MSGRRPPQATRGGEGQEAREGAVARRRCVDSAVEALQHRQSKGTARRSRKATPCRTVPRIALRACPPTGSRITPKRATARIACPFIHALFRHGRRARGVESRRRGGTDRWPPTSTPEVTEQESLKVAETARQAEWVKPSFMREFFLGNFRLDLIHPFPLPGTSARSSRRSTAKLHDFLRDEVDPAEIDRTGEYPPEVLDGLRRLGRLRDEDPGEVRRARLHERRVQPRDDADRAATAATSARCSPRTSRSACRSRSRRSAPRSSRRSTCPAAPRARSRPSPSRSRASAPTPRAC